MMSLSMEWALLSREMYGQAFIDELGDFFDAHNVRTILECGCGDGYVLHGLAKKGFHGVGIDASFEMISLALAEHTHPNLSYLQMNWLGICPSQDWMCPTELKQKFDAVMYRGNSLQYVASWGKESIKPEDSRRKIEKSVELFFQKIKEGGMLYVDTCSQAEVERNGGPVEISTPNYQLTGTVEYDWKRMERRVFGSGKAFGQDFRGGSASYLLTPLELERIVRRENPSVVWTPELKEEKNYHIMCARK